MKHLLLLRHAQTDPATSTQSDHARTLTQDGEKQALIAGKFLRENDLAPDLILSSDAKRTCQTAQFVKDGLRQESIPHITKSKLYNCAPQTIHSHIQHIDNNVKTLLVINHNPAIHQIAFELSRGNSEIAMSYPPCSLTHLIFEEDDWYLLDKTKTRFHSFHSGNMFLKSL